MPDRISPLRQIPSEAIGIPANSPSCWIWKDVGKRVSRCHACQEAIPKQTERYVMLVRFSWRTFRHGGANCQKCYLHTSCFEVARRDDARRRCFDCDVDLPTTVGFTKSNWVSTGSRSAVRRLCDSCAEQKHYARCDSCNLIFPKNRVSKLLQPDDVTMRVCYDCETEEGITTVKSQARARREEEVFTERYQAILHKITQEGIFW